MSDDESRHDLPTEGGAIFAENGSETVEEDQTGSTFMDCSINSTLHIAHTSWLSKNLEKLVIYFDQAD